MQNELDVLDEFDVHAMTTVSTSDFKFKWTVTDISRLGKSVTSPIFKIPFLSECSLRLNWDSSNKIVVELLLKTNSVKEKWSFCMFDKKGLKLCSSETYFISSTLSLTTGAAIPVSSLPSEVLVIIVHFSTDKITSEILKFQHPLHNDCHKTLVSDFKALYDHPRHTDVVLKVEGEAIKAHKFILSARSPVFKKMFLTPMTESEEHLVPIEDASLHHMKQFLEFLYTGSVELSDDVLDIYSLYYLADKYEVMDLKSMCAEAMRSKITVENAVSQVIWADRHKDDAFKASVMDFVSWNFKSITDSEDWSSFVSNQGKLAAFLVKYCVDKGASFS